MTKKSVSEIGSEEIADGRARLERWQSSAEFIALVEELFEPIGNEPLFNRAALKFLHDAFVLAEFTRFRAPEMVRLVAEREQWPDGQIGTSQQPINVEITEVLEEGRRRGREYRGDNDGPNDGGPAEWRKRALSIPGQLEHAIERKRQKSYAAKCLLVVYLNVGNYGLLQKETEAAIGAVKAKYASDFTEICVLWQDKLL